MPHDPLLLVAANLCVAAVLRAVKPNLATAMVLAVVAIGVTGYVGSQYGHHVLALANRLRDQTLAATGRPPSWPPQRGCQFPDQGFIDGNGQPRRLAEFRGKVVLVHVVGTPSRTSIAFAGGAAVGPFQGVSPQDGLDSISTYAWQYGKVRLDDGRLRLVHLVLFNRDMRAPAQTELLEWERHFQTGLRDNEVVWGGKSELATAASRAMIPGFLLIDRDSIVRSSAAGSDPDDDLYLELLPMLGDLLETN